MADAAASIPGRAVRFIVTTAIGLLGIFGIVAGPVSGAIDSFLVDKVLPKSGVWTFVNRLYPSIFKRNSVHQEPETP